jgi:sec-independent protein translocase protein TatB
MFDISGTDLLLIGTVALIVVGPKDLPDMFRQVGRFTAKLRQMGREFSRAIEQAAKESGVDEVRRDLKAATSPVTTGMQNLKSAADKFEKWDPVKNAARPTTTAKAAPLTPPPMPSAAPDAVAAPANTAVGPATQALIDKTSARKAIMDEMNAKLRALDEAPAAEPEAIKRAPGRTRKPKAPKE